MNLPAWVTSTRRSATVFAPTRVAPHQDADFSDMRLLVADRFQGEDLSEPMVVARYHQSVPLADVVAHLAACVGNVEVVDLSEGRESDLLARRDRVALLVERAEADLARARLWQHDRAEVLAAEQRLRAVQALQSELEGEVRAAVRCAVDACARRSGGRG
jgi:hypothetical protein